MENALKEFIKIKSQQDWRENTTRNTKYVLEDFIRSIGPQSPVESVTETCFQSHFLNRDDIKYETKLSHKKKLKTFLLWLDENKLARLTSSKLHIENNSSEQAESINYFTREDIEKLTSYISSKVASDIKKGFQTENFNALWLIDFIHWQRLSGMRLSETLHLRAGDIDT
ncbi:hypothetical protein [Rhodohalobacter sp.]|uniref:hypothetical protein n=1 Tax=Rhodohalobacter sp. TaxID=1974210 RepID=UPI002ACF09DC|nr:hypothetical protein [Rhodohalobacter sp.]MDZ7757214.1 hypothetical protein [Rhodohalobacter sp.]